MKAHDYVALHFPSHARPVLSSCGGLALMTVAQGVHDELPPSFTTKRRRWQALGFTKRRKLPVHAWPALLMWSRTSLPRPSKKGTLQGWRTGIRTGDGITSTPAGASHLREAMLGCEAQHGGGT